MTREARYLYRREGRRLLILDAETLAEVGFVEVPEHVTVADAERFREHLMKLAADAERGPN